MKRLSPGVVSISVLLVGVILVLMYPRGSVECASLKDTSGISAASDTSFPVLSVDSVAARPEHFSGRISVLGVVSHVSPKDRVVVLISEEEFAACRTACPIAALPVRWPGILPSMNDRVLVRGRVEKTKRGFLFRGDSAKTLTSGKKNAK